MAEYDGSIRIGVKVDTDNAKKQLENLKKRQLEQVKAINEQVKSIQKLEEQYKRLTDASIEPKGIEKLEKSLKKAQEEAAKLDEEYQRLQQISQIELAATGVISPETTSRLQEISDQMATADAKADALNKQLEKLRMPPEASEEAKRLAEEISNAKERLGQMQEESGKTASEITKLQSWPAQLGSRIAEISSKIKGFFTKSVNNAARSTKNLHANMHKVGSNRGFSKASKSADGFLDKLGKIINRIKQIAVSALVFNVFRRAFSELSKQISSYLTVNKQFTDSLSTIKGNLLTAFQPIYETIIPALNELMGILQEASAILAKFMATLFGTTPKKAQDNAKALKEQAEAAEDVADETKKAEKALASFDTIEILGNKKEEEKKDKTTGKTEAKFDQDFEDVQVPKWLDVLGDKLKEIMGWLKDFFKPIKEAWDKYGAPVVEALKRALSAIWNLIKAIMETFLKIWNSDIAQKTLQLIFSILETIFNIIADIADTFRKVWESGEGEKLLKNLFTLLNTILAIILDISTAFREAWSNYGEEVVRALFFAINSVLELLNSVGEAFREAWNDNGRGQKIFETILQIVRDIFNTVGEFANRIKEAWEANDNGKRIWAAILDSVQAILNFIHDITNATLEWAQNINLEPLLSSVRGLLENIKPLIETIGETLSGIYRDIILPFLTWLLESALPNAIDLISSVVETLSSSKGIWEFIKTILGNIFDFIKNIADATLEWAKSLDTSPLVESFQKVLDVIKPLVETILNGLAWAYENILLPIAKWVIEDAAPASIEVFSEALRTVSIVLEAVIELIKAIWPIIEPIAEFLGGVFVVALKAVAFAIGLINDGIEFLIDLVKSAIEGVKELAKWLGDTVSGWIGLGNSGNSFMGGFGGFGATMPYSASTFSMERFADFNAAYNVDNIPHLANGAVISPNSEYLAVLGDQKAGKNIESPLSTIEQALDNVMSRRGGDGNTTVEVNFTGSLSQLARVLRPEIRIAEQQKGSSLVSFGGMSSG